MLFNYITWNIDPEIINLFGLSLRYYGLLFVGGLILCISILRWIFKREGIQLEYLDKLSTYGIIGIFLGARLGHCLFYEPAYYFSHPIEILLPIEFTADGSIEIVGYRGLASHGGIIGLAIGLILCARKAKESLLKTIDIISVVAALGGFFIRMANLMNSEMIGIPADVPWAFIFSGIDDLPRHPAQLYEAIAYLLIFIITFFVYKTNRARLQSGFMFGLAFTLIFIARFFIEFVKEKQVAFEEQMMLDMGQLLSIPFILVGIAFIVMSFRRKL